MGREYFLLEGTENVPDAEVIGKFIEQFYEQAPYVPPQVLLPQDIEEMSIIKQWLNSRSEDQRVEILVPREGVQRELIQMAAENAAETLAALQAKWKASRHRQTEALADLQSALGLETPPNRIECYDISNTQGTAAVGSMVVFEQGVPKKNLYRRFNIRSVMGPDDYASMEEVLVRRFNRWKSAQELADAPGKKPDQAFARLPDLLIVDGGKGQLNRALAVLGRFELRTRFMVAALAKGQEELFLPRRAKPLLLPRRSQGLFLIQRVRDEAHRFAIASHRQRRMHKGLASRLDAIPGIGPARRKALLARFGSIENIQHASTDELSSLPGITPQIARTIKTHLA